MAAYLYGSVVSGKDTADSDVDIALLAEPYKDPIESCKARIRYQVEISRLLERNVDLVFLQDAGELLSLEILKSGKVIFERNVEAHRSFRASRLIQCLDFRLMARGMEKGMVAAMRREGVGK